jgi:nucleotide-binding universal stress UspA family protein
MQSFKSILVDVDSAASAHPALDRAVLLARTCGAALTITEVMTLPSHARRYLPPALEEVMVSERRQQLARMAQEVTDVRTESRLLVGRPGTVLIQEILRSNHDLLMRSHARDVVAPGPKPLGAVDMELLRQCPCPVLLVRHGSPAPRPHVVGAVNASAQGSEEQALNEKIVELTLLMAAHLEASSLSILSAWAPFAERTIRSHAAVDEFAAYVDDARQRAATDLARLLRPFEGRGAETRSALRRGEPEDVIPEFVVAQGIDLVVMGTVARAGIAGMLIGNTAERVLRKLPCSVLTVKPDGCVSPVRLDPS